MFFSALWRVKPMRAMASLSVPYNLKKRDDQMSDDKDKKSRRDEALRYHQNPRPGKLEINPTKPLSSQRDLSLAYTPGVAEPCREIADDPLNSYKYTNRANLVGVVTDGSATLGLGDIGALASKPVMEGKAVLFKHLAGVDAFDIELDTDNVEAFINCVRAMEPTFGGINLEDIAAPACFEIEERLSEQMKIPVFHDDQHGTAIITGAALLNALDLQDKEIDQIQVVFSGAGAAGVACAKLYESLGVPHSNIMFCDSTGVIHTGRDDLNEQKEQFVVETDKRTMADAFEGADVFVGVSVANIVSKEMVASMAERPIIFALANPDPEISYPDAMDVRDDLVMATGRSDFPNQVNNVLGFPFIFRGALDVAASSINEEMKLAAVHALADLAREEVPEVVSAAYDKESFRYGREYIIPKPFDPRALLRVAPAVAKAACESGVARQPIEDFADYKESLEHIQSASKGLIRGLINKARRDPKRIIFPEGSHHQILRAASLLVDEGIAQPVLMGNAEHICRRAKQHDIDLGDVEIFDPAEDERRDEMIRAYYELRQRKGVTLAEAKGRMSQDEVYAMMMLRKERVDGVVSGQTKAYAESLRPALRVVGVAEGVEHAAGAYIVVSREHGVKFFADTTVNIDPDARALAETALKTSQLARALDIDPKIAMLSYSAFGTSRHPAAAKVAEATKILREQYPELAIDGEMQADAALDPELRSESFDFAQLNGEANVLVFPNLDAGNISYKLIDKLGEADVIGPVLLGMKQAVNVLQRGSSVASIVNLTVLTVINAHEKQAEQ
jgi:malate dehydrogenase (oxaloacetate-decarboxylating)(NADP+)